MVDLSSLLKRAQVCLGVSELFLFVVAFWSHLLGWMWVMDVIILFWHDIWLSDSPILAHFGDRVSWDVMRLGDACL